LGSKASCAHIRAGQLDGAYIALNDRIRADSLDEHNVTGKEFSTSLIRAMLSSLHMVRAAELSNPVSFCYGCVVRIIDGNLPAFLKVLDD
jgi:hypothetical protein